jgi:hypothetical protein
VKRSKRRRTALTVLALPVAALLAYAWVDGGREPVRDIVQTLPISQSAPQATTQSAPESAT